MSLGKNDASNPSLISPKQFVNELRKIRAIALEYNLDLPVPGVKNNLHLLYQMSQVGMVLIENQLILCFKLPLVSKQKFNLYKFTNFPILLEQSYYAYVNPQKNYIGLNNEKDKYISLNRHQVKNCFKITNTNLICKQTFPIFEASNSDVCEIDLLRNMNNSVNCNVYIHYIVTKKENCHYISKKLLYINQRGKFEPLLICRRPEYVNKPDQSNKQEKGTALGSTTYLRWYAMDRSESQSSYHEQKKN